MRLIDKKIANRAALTRLSVIALLIALLAAALSGGTGANATLPSGIAPSSAPTQSIGGAAAVPLTNLQYGFTMALLGNNGLVRSMGFNWVSYTLGWDSAEPFQGQYNWGDTNNIVNSARTTGINVLIRVSRSPEWARASNCSTNPTCPPRDARLYGDFLGTLTSHVNALQGPIRVAYELWNEPNTDNEWGGMCPDPALYAAMVRAAYPRIKSADPDALVVAGSVTTVGQVAAPHCAMDDIAFLRAMYQAGAAPYFDVLSDHPYGFIYAPETDPADAGPRLVFRRAERHRELMLEFGDGAKQIWATEIGWALDPALSGHPECPRPDWYFVYSPQQQADYLVRAYAWARSYWPWMGAMFTFNFDFNEAPWYQPCDAFPFWSVKGRPAQSALASFAHNPPPTYTPNVDNPPVVGATRYSALTFGRVGGTLTVDVDASDNDITPIDTVQAALHYPDGTTQTFTLALASGTNRNGTWRGNVAIPPNNGPTAQTYTVNPYALEVNPPGRTTNAPPQPITVSDTRFLDVPSDYWAYTYIEYLANAGVISGYSDNSFRPGNNATRGQFSKMIVVAEGWPIDLTGAPHFTDVAPNNPFYPFIETAVNRGVINGYSDSTFRFGNDITRGQISKIVVLAEGWALQTPPVPTFNDVLPDSAFYQFVETAVEHDIVSGYSDGTFRPNANATRAQLSKMLYLALIARPPTQTPTPPATTTPTQTPTPTITQSPTQTPTQAEPTSTPMKGRR